MATLPRRWVEACSFIYLGKENGDGLTYLLTYLLPFRSAGLCQAVLCGVFCFMEVVRWPCGREGGNCGAHAEEL